MLNLSGVKLTPEETHSQVTLITLYSEPMVTYFQLNNSLLSYTSYNSHVLQKNLVYIN